MLVSSYHSMMQSTNNCSSSRILVCKGYVPLQVLIISCVLMIWLSAEQGDARPAYESWSVYKAALAGKLPHKANQCEILNSVKELCQRCAKDTKSNLVYPLCCENQEGVQSWCESYVNYGD